MFGGGGTYLGTADGQIRQVNDVYLSDAARDLATGVGPGAR
jgi:hypothetical protein